MHLSRSDFFLNSGTKVSKSEVQQIEKITEALKKFEPLQYIFGETSFYGLDFKVNSHVLIPRSETEELVDWLLKENDIASCSTIDLGTGSGCIAVTIARHRPHWEITAIDVSNHALLVAQENAALNGVSNIRFMEENMFAFSEQVLSTKFDIMVSNPPYVTSEQSSEMHQNVLNYEPHIALFAPGPDPLIFYRKIAELAVTNLIRGGKVYLELNEVLGCETEAIFKQQGFETMLKKDIRNKNRMLKAYRHE
jgi:release factor glutamine methyltransferase